MKPLFRLLTAVVLTMPALMPMASTSAAAQAAPAPSLVCEGGGSHWSCILGNAQGISWWVNGKHARPFDGLNYIHGRCALNEQIGVKVRYFHHGSIGEKGRAVRCPREMP